jgi:hypothetical protein
LLNTIAAPFHQPLRSEPNSCSELIASAGVERGWLAGRAMHIYSSIPELSGKFAENRKRQIISIRILTTFEANMRHSILFDD